MHIGKFQHKNVRPQHFYLPAINYVYVPREIGEFFAILKQK